MTESNSLVKSKSDELEPRLELIYLWIKFIIKAIITGITKSNSLVKSKSDEVDLDWSP